MTKRTVTAAVAAVTAILTLASGCGASQSNAATMLVIAPLLIAFFIFQRQFISSFMMSGVK